MTEPLDRGDAAAAGLLCALTAVFLAPALSQGGSSVIGSPACDVLGMFYPHRAFANAMWQSGRIPLWNPHLFCGHPFHAEGQGAVFYPLNLALAGLGASWAMNIFALTHFAAAGIFFHLYLRAAGLGKGPALLGALAYSYSSGPISRLYAGHFTIMPFLALVPMYLWAWERWRGGGGVRWGVVAATAIGGMALAGYPQLLLYAGMYFGFIAIAASLAAARAGQRRRAFRPLLFCLASGVAGGLLGAVQLLPSYSFARESFRQQATFEFSASFSFAPENLLTLIAPLFFGGMGSDAYWGRNYLWEMWIYIGILPLGLALLAALRGTRFQTRLHLVAFALFMALALGRHTPLFRLLYEGVPFFRLFRGSSKFSFFALISLCALAAHGAGLLCDARDEEKRRTHGRTLLILLTVLLAGSVGVFAIFAPGSGDPDGLWQRFVGWRFAQGVRWHENYTPGSSIARNPSGEFWYGASASIFRAGLMASLGIAFVAVGRRAKDFARMGMVGCCILSVLDLWQLNRRHVEMAQLDLAAIPASLAGVLERAPRPFRVYDSDLGRANAPEAMGLDSPGGYVGNITQRMNHYLTVSNKRPRELPMVFASATRLNDAVLWPNVTYLILRIRDQIPAELAQRVGQSADNVLYRLVNPVPRLYFSNGFVRVADSEEALKGVESGRLPLPEKDIVECADTALLTNVAPAAEGDSLRVVQWEPTRIGLSASAVTPRLLVLSDAYESNWRCAVDGAPATILPVNLAFRGVALDKGSHSVVFEYRPRSFYWGAFVSIAAWLAALGALAMGLCRRRRGGPALA